MVMAARSWSSTFGTERYVAYDNRPLIVVFGGTALTVKQIECAANNNQRDMPRIMSRH